MFMVLPLIDEIADIMKDRGVLEPRTFRSAQFVEALCLIKQPQRKARDVQAMNFGCLTPAGECNDIPPTKIGYFSFCFEPFAVPVDEVVDDTLANRLIAERQFILPRQFHEPSQNQ